MIGSTIGSYTITGSLGSGGMAKVYLADHALLNRKVAIKVVHPHLAENEEFLKRFQREAQSGATLQHPNILRIYDYAVTADGLSYLVMEYIKGRSLQGYLDDWRRQNGEHTPLPLDEALGLIGQLGSALSHAHRHGIIHRDVKPDNVMLDSDGRVVLADFGLAKMVSGASYTATGAILGTPAYIAPEQGMGEQGDHRADIYALGVMLYEMVIGRLPFNSATAMGMVMQHISTPPPDPHTINPNVPADVCRLILKALEKNPQNRFQSVDEMLSALGQERIASGVYEPPTTQEFPPPLLEPELINTVLGAPPPPVYETPVEEEKGVEQEIASAISQLPSPFQAPPLIPNFVNNPALLAQIRALATDTTSQPVIIGLYGLAAVGKSTFAAYLAHHLRDEFSDGILWNNLSDGTLEGELISIATAYGQTETVSRLNQLEAKAEFVRQVLSNKRVLLIVDQVETSEQLQVLRQTGKRCVTLATTRNQKLIHNIGGTAVEVTPFEEEQTLEYLREALGQARVQAELDEAKKLHNLTGGLPLALSIVVGYLQDSPELTLGEYNEILQDEQKRLSLLSDWMDANRDVAASFELSYQTLPEPIQKLFATFSLFAGPDFDAQAVAAIANMPVAHVKLALGRLQALSLVNRKPTQRMSLVGQRSTVIERYQINPLLRLFARQKLGPDTAAYEARAAAYFTELAVRLAEQNNYDELDFEWENMAVALRWAYDQQMWQPLLRGVLALTDQALGVLGYTEARGHWTEARELLQWAAEAAYALDDILAVAIVMTRLGGFAVRQSDFENVERWLDEAEEEFQKLPPSAEQRLQLANLCGIRSQQVEQKDRVAALAHIERGLSLLAEVDSSEAASQKGILLTRRASLEILLGEFSAAQTTAEAALAALPTHPNPARIDALTALSKICYWQGRNQTGFAYVQQALPLARELGDAHRLATLWLTLGFNDQSTGQLQEAITNYQKAIALYKQMGDVYYESGVRINLGQVYFMLGEDEKAADQWTRALTLATNHDLPHIIAMVLSNMADLEIANGSYEAAVPLLTRSLALTDELKLAHLRPTLRRAQAQATLGLGDPTTAQTHLTEALALAQHTEDRLEIGICWRVQGEISAAAGDAAAAEKAYEQSVDMLADQDPFQRALSKMAYAAHAPEQSLSIGRLQEARDTFKRLNAGSQLAAAEALLAKLAG